MVLIIGSIQTCNVNKNNYKVNNLLFLFARRGSASGKCCKNKTLISLCQTFLLLCCLLYCQFIFSCIIYNNRCPFVWSLISSFFNQVFCFARCTAGHHVWLTLSQTLCPVESWDNWDEVAILDGAPPFSGLWFWTNVIWTKLSPVVQKIASIGGPDTHLQMSDWSWCRLGEEKTKQIDSWFQLWFY